MQISENISYAYPEATYTEIREAAKAANCLEFIQRMPQGFQTQVGARGRTLSGGQVSAQLPALSIQLTLAIAATHSYRKSITQEAQDSDTR